MNCGNRLFIDYGIRMRELKTGKYKGSVFGGVLVWILMITSCANASGLSEKRRTH